MPEGAGSQEGRLGSKGPGGPGPGRIRLRPGGGRARLFPVRVDEEETELEAVGEAELAEDGGQVGLDRSFPDLEPGRNLFVRGAGADQEGDLPLAPREQIQPAVGLRQTLGLLLGVLRVLLEEPRDQLALGPDLTVMDAVHDLAKDLGVDVLLAVALGAGFQDANAFQLVGPRRQENDLRVPGESTDDRPVADPVDAEKLDVQEQNIGVQDSDVLLQERPVGDFAKRIGADEPLLPAGPGMDVRGRDENRRGRGGVGVRPPLARGMGPTESGHARGTGDAAHPRGPPGRVVPGGFLRSPRVDFETKPASAPRVVFPLGGTRRCLVACLMALSVDINSNPYARQADIRGFADLLLAWSAKPFSARD